MDSVFKMEWPVLPHTMYLRVCVVFTIYFMSQFCGVIAEGRGLCSDAVQGEEPALCGQVGCVRALVFVSKADTITMCTLLHYSLQL